MTERKLSELRPHAYRGYHIMVVDPGTVIKDERSGREETVTDGDVVAKGSLLYCTEFMEKALKRAIDQQTH